MSTTMEHVVEVTDENFERTVIEGSTERPVVVDLWAEWCGPCRTLGPLLEKVAGERDGAFLLAKLDVDHNAVGQSLLQAVRSQSIPTVVAFRDGQPVSMFIGAYPEAELNRFVDSILPTEAELGAKEAERAFGSGDVDAAEQGFRDVLADDPDNLEAGLGLAKLLVDRGAFDEAEPLVTKHLPAPEAERLRAVMEVESWSGEPGDGSLAMAKRLAAAGDWAAALNGMAAALDEDRDAARQAMITAFAALGEEHPLVPEYRRRLAAALF
jgi:putative thioredoxin